MATGTHSRKPGRPSAEPDIARATLTPDAQFSRNVSFHVVTDLQGEQIWIGRYMLDLLEYAAVCHPEGLLVEIEGIRYTLTVARTPKGA